jgi:hypothetical protein
VFRVSLGWSVCRGDLGDGGSGGCLVDEVLAGAGGRDQGGDGDVVDGPWLAGQILALGSGPFSSLDWPDGDGYLRCAHQLAEIQERAGAFFPLPIAIEPEDQCWMDYADKLLHGVDVQITWPGSTRQCDRNQVRFFLEETARIGEAFTFFNRRQETLEFARGKVPLGWVTNIAHSAKIDNLGELRTWYESGGEGRIEVRLARQQ